MTSTSAVASLRYAAGSTSDAPAIGAAAKTGTLTTAPFPTFSTAPGYTVKLFNAARKTWQPVSSFPRSPMPTSVDVAAFDAKTGAQVTMSIKAYLGQLRDERGWVLRWDGSKPLTSAPFRLITTRRGTGPFNLALVPSGVPGNSIAGTATVPAGQQVQFKDDGGVWHWMEHNSRFGYHEAVTIRLANRSTGQPTTADVTLTWSMPGTHDVAGGGRFSLQVGNVICFNPAEGAGGPSRGLKATPMSTLKTIAEERALKAGISVQQLALNNLKALANAAALSDTPYQASMLVHLHAQLQAQLAALNGTSHCSVVHLDHEDWIIHLAAEPETAIEWSGGTHWAHMDQALGQASTSASGPAPVLQLPASLPAGWAMTAELPIYASVAAFEASGLRKSLWAATSAVPMNEDDPSTKDLLTRRARQKMLGPYGQVNAVIDDMLKSAPQAVKSFFEKIYKDVPSELKSSGATWDAAWYQRSRREDVSRRIVTSGRGLLRALLDANLVSPGVVTPAGKFSQTSDPTTEAALQEVRRLSPPVFRQLMGANAGIALSNMAGRRALLAQLAFAPETPSQVPDPARRGKFLSVRAAMLQLLLEDTPEARQLLAALLKLLFLRAASGKSGLDQLGPPPPPPPSGGAALLAWGNPLGGPITTHDNLNVLGNVSRLSTSTKVTAVLTRSMREVTADAGSGFIAALKKDPAGAAMAAAGVAALAGLHMAAAATSGVPVVGEATAALAAGADVTLGVAGAVMYAVDGQSNWQQIKDAIAGLKEFLKYGPTAKFGWQLNLARDGMRTFMKKGGAAAFKVLATLAGLASGAYGAGKLAGLLTEGNAAFKGLDIESLVAKSGKAIGGRLKGLFGKFSRGFSKLTQRSWGQWFESWGPYLKSFFAPRSLKANLGTLHDTIWSQLGKASKLMTNLSGAERTAWLEMTTKLKVH